VSDQEYVLDQMINLVRDLNPDVMVIAGDVFHQRRPNEETLALFHDTLNRLLNLGTIVVFLSGPTDDFRNLHLDARWVREAGIYLFDDATQVLSPLTFQGARDDFEVSAWCLPYPKGTNPGTEEQHPALLGHALVEKVVQRLNPSEVNIFLGYAWAQDSGRRPELGTLVLPGGQPLEKRLLDFFDVSALGGCHDPLVLSGPAAQYCGSLLCYEPDSASPGRSVTLYDIEAKANIHVDQYPLRPRRTLRVLRGSWEELMAQGRQLRSDDLIVLRSEEADLTPEQRADLRVLGPNIVSLELPSPLGLETESEEMELPAMVRSFQLFAEQMTGNPLSEESLQILLGLDRES
jgi:DNA repair protein SbcD/Mre11